MTAITESTIQVMYKVELARALELRELGHWKHHPKPDVVIKSMGKRVYGRASSRGIVTISTLFIGTEAHDSLLDTVRHELAHLLAGTAARHGSAWKVTARLLGADPSSTGEAGCATLEDKMRGKYELIAHFEDGTSKTVGYMHKRSAARLNYKPTEYRWKHVQGKKIMRFSYKLRDNNANKRAA